MPSNRPLQYTVEDVPPAHITILLGFQQFLTMMGGSIAMPLIIAEACCVGPDLVGRAEIMGTLMFVNGIVTLMQIYLGVRLPIIQGASFAFIVPMMGMQNLGGHECPSDEDYATWKVFPGSPQHRHIWMSRLVEIQGAILMAGVLEALIGSLGLVSYIFRFVGPLTITPTMALIELSLVHEIISQYASKYWPISLLAMAIVLASTLYLPNVSIPIPVISFMDLIRHRKFTWEVNRLRIFSLFPVLLALTISWGLYAILKFYDLLPKTAVSAKFNVTIIPEGYRSELSVAPWFRVPYPGQWGLPEINLALTVGMFAAVISSIIESIGDYIACARMCGVSVPPAHAINRGITVEGLGCIVAGAFGCGSGVSSYAENVGAIGITGVASRRVILVTAIVLLFLGCFTKLATFFVMIPEPVIGGTLIAILSMVIGVGFSNLQFVDLNSTRNLLIFGLSIFLGLGIPPWIVGHRDYINTGFDILNEVINILLSTGMFVGGVVGFVLDNTVPRDPDEEEKPNIFGLSNEAGNSDETYQFPCKLCRLVEKVPFLRYVPISPTFNRERLCNLLCSFCRRKPKNEIKLENGDRNVVDCTAQSHENPSVAIINEALDASPQGSLASFSNVPVVSHLPRMAPLVPGNEEKWSNL